MQHNRLEYYREFEYEDDEMASFMTAQEVMELLYIGKSTLYRLLRSGELKGFRAGKQWRIAREDFQKFCGKER